MYDERGVGRLLERYGHGGDLLSAKQIYGIPEHELLDYSSNMNPLGPPPVVNKILTQFMQTIGQYPDPAVRKLRAAIAQKHRIDMSNILVGNGAAEVIDLIVRYIQPARAAIASPCFIEYEQALEKVGASIYRIPLRADKQFVLGGEEVQQALVESGAQLYFLGQPNNPTGQYVKKEIIETLLQSGAYVVLDEAFIDFHPAEDQLTWIQHIKQYERLFVIRSMTKFYSIPAIRLGYIVGNASCISKMKSLQIPWSVNTLAQQIGAEVLADTEFEMRSKAWLRSEALYFSDALKKLKLTVFPTETNYVLVCLKPHYSFPATALQQAMGMQGILIRDASSFHGLDDSYIRLAIKSRAENDRCISTLSWALNKLQEGG